jgi:hypothetical protein
MMACGFASDLLTMSLVEYTPSGSADLLQYGSDFSIKTASVKCTANIIL